VDKSNQFIFVFRVGWASTVLACALTPLAAQEKPREDWRASGSAGFGASKSNLYSPGLSPIQQKEADKPAKLLNFLTPQDGLPAKQTSQVEDEQDKRSGRQESIDGLLDNDLKAFDSQANPPSRGGTEIVRQRYPDGKIQVEREVVQDDVGNYQNHGWWKLYNKSGQVIGDGIFERGLMEGPWKRLHAAAEGGIFGGKPFDLFQGPFLSTATFEQGKLSGVWQIYDRNQRKIMEITYVGGKRHGPATWWYPDGVKMREMSFRNGMLDGKLLEWDAKNKLVRDEEFVEGRRISIVTTEHAPGRKKTQIQSLEAKLVLTQPDDWWEAKPASYETEGTAYQHGPFMAYYENGQLEMEGQFFDDLREGQFTWWHANGQKSVVGHYKKGQQDGVWIWWHANGMKMAEGRYENNRQVGTWTKWDEDGKLIDRQDLTPDDVLPDPKEKQEVTKSPSSEQTPPRPEVENPNGEPKAADDPPLGLGGSEKPDKEQELQKVDGSTSPPGTESPKPEKDGGKKDGGKESSNSQLGLVPPPRIVPAFQSSTFQPPVTHTSPLVPQQRTNAPAIKPSEEDVLDQLFQDMAKPTSSGK
jgi:antitoxin component YwqK of YwqJK toxin-antitoxin module